MDSIGFDLTSVAMLLIQFDDRYGDMAEKKRGQGKIIYLDPAQ